MMNSPSITSWCCRLLAVAIIWTSCEPSSNTESTHKDQRVAQDTVPDLRSDVLLRMADSLHYAGIAAIDSGSNERGMDLLREAIRVCDQTKTGYPKVKANCYARISSRARNLYMADTMTKYGNLALDMLRNKHNELGDSLCIAICGHLIPMCRGMHRLEDARELSLQMTDAAIRLNDPSRVLFAWKNTAAVYKDLGDFRQAINYGNKFIRGSHEHGLLKPASMLQGHQLMGECYSNLRNADSALAHYRMAWTYSTNIHDEPSRANRLYLGLHMLNYYTALDTRPDSILHYVQLVEELLDDTHGAQSTAIRQQQLRPRVLNAYALQGQLALADSLARTDLKSVLDLSNPDDHIHWDSLPEPTSVESQLDKYAGIYTTIYYFDKSPRYAHALLRLYDEIDRAKIALMEETDPRLLLMDALHLQRLNDYRLMVLFDMGDERPIDGSGLAALFEQRKALQLRAALRSEKSRAQRSGVGDGLEALYGQRSAIERQGSQLDSASIHQLGAIDDQIAAIRSSVTGMRSRNGTIPAKERWQEWMRTLDDSTMVINYAWTDSILLLLSLERDHFSFEYRRIYPWLDSTLTMAQHYFQDDDARNEPDHLLLALCDTLLPRGADWKNCKRLIIVPDGRLNALPFEALRTTREAGSLNLLEWKDIRYEYCLTFLSEPNPSPNEALSGTGFAPSFDRPLDTTESHRTVSRFGIRSNAFGPLTENKAELEAIQGIFDIDGSYGSQATERSAREQLPRSLVVHFASHAICSDTVAELSGVLFGPPSMTGTGSDTLWNDNVLFAYEIQGMNLSADLITLSACETASGENRAGEGAMSLARAFKYAGAKSIVSSLWKVDDRATKEIMVKFYEKLAEGMGKADALAQAKRWYRKENPNAPPSHWAAFILIGDNEPVLLKKRSPLLPWMWVAGGVLILAGAGLWASRRNKARAVA